MQANMTYEEAELLAIEGLQYIAGHSEELSRFLALSGLSPVDLRDAADSPAFLSGVLDYFMGDEAVLLAFAAARGRDPSDIGIARMVISRGKASDD